MTIGVPSASAGAEAHAPAAPVITVQRVGEQVHITGDVRVLDRTTASHFADAILEAVR